MIQSPITSSIFVALLAMLTACGGSSGGPSPVGPIQSPTPDSSSETPASTASPSPTSDPTPSVTMTPTPMGDTTLLEAESATIMGTNAELYDDERASGAMGVAFLTAEGDGFGFTDVPLSRSFTIRYATEVSGTFSFSINGGPTQKFSFTESGAWTGSYAETSVNTEIPEGAEVAFFFANGDSAFNVDWVEFSPETSSSNPQPQPTPATSIAGKFAPAAPNVLMFAGQDNLTVGGNHIYTDGYVDHIGVPAGITHYIGFSGDTVGGLDVTNDWRAGPMNLKHYVDSSTLDGTIMHLAIDMVGAEQAVANGEKDQHIAALANFLNDYTDHPFIIRIGYEFDGGHNDYDPEGWRSAWIRIVDQLREANVTNFATMMHALSQNTPAATWDRYYPGDDYVDWMGYSYWSDGGTNTSSIDYARQKGKPICICEASPVGFDMELGNGTDIWNNWFIGFFNHIQAHEDVIRAVSYINTDWPSQKLWETGFFATTDARIQMNSTVETHWLEKMEEENYIHTPTGVFDLIQFEAQ